MVDRAGRNRGGSELGRNKLVNKAMVPIVARLQALQTVAQVNFGGARTLADMSDPQPLAALLREVNETVLGRTLTFVSGTGASIALEVAGRRVLRLVTADGVADAESCLATPALDDSQKDALIKVLQAVAARGHDLNVTSQPIGREADEVSVGLPVALLADLLLIDLDALPGSADAPALTPELVYLTRPEPAEPAPAGSPSQSEIIPFGVAQSGTLLQRFALQIGPSFMAWLIRGGVDDGVFFGPDEMVSHLGDFLDSDGAALMVQLDRIATVPGGTVALGLGANLQDGHCTICARHGEGLLLGLLEGETAKLLPQAWAAAHGNG